MDNGDYQSFAYTGGIQTFTVPNSGVYKLECWGAGNVNNGYDRSGTAYGGYVCGYKYIKKGTVLYICCGGSAGYNGGGTGRGYHNAEWAYASCNNGSGATHIAKVTGLLEDIGETSFCDNGNGYLIAGGAGGCATFSIADGTTTARRGKNGGTGGDNNRFGYGNSNTNSDPHYGPGGGAGYRGGLATDGSGSVPPSEGGHGGTNWTGNVPEFTYKGVTYTPSSQSGTGSDGDGRAVITLMKKNSNIKYGGNDVIVYYGNNEVLLYYGNNEL